MEGLLVSLLTSSIFGGTTTMSANLVLSKLFFCLVLLYLIQNLVLIGRKEGKHNKTCSALLRMHSQQTFVLMKTFWKCRSSSSSEEVLIKTNNRLTHTSSEVVLIKVNIFYIYICFICFQACQNVFKMYWRHLCKVYRKDVFKTYDQAKLFLLTRFQDAFEKYSKRFWDILQRRLSTKGFA